MVEIFKYNPNPNFVEVWIENPVDRTKVIVLREEIVNVVMKMLAIYENTKQENPLRAIYENNRGNKYE